jgi:alpha-tubulin suppressor-like RCC1 family protein
VELQPLVPRPTTLLDLHGVQATQLVAGKLSSAAVLASGEVWTWGCGKSGKLGHGSAASLRSPHRVSLWSADTSAPDSMQTTCVVGSTGASGVAQRHM